MTPEEVAEMLELRCRRAAIPFPFTGRAVKVLYEFSGGIPRLVLQAAEFSYAQMLEQELPSIEDDLVETVVSGLTIDDDDAE
jgi:hypothetical protein